MDTQLTQREAKGLEKVNARPTVTPRVDIFENDEELLLIADLPGVSEKELAVHLDDEQLSLSATWTPEENGTPLAREFRPLDYQRAFVLPPGIDSAKIHAELTGGVLRLHLPKAASSRPRRIEVKAG